MTPAQAEALLFDETVACEERRPAAFVAASGLTPGQLAASGEALLRALAVVEDGPRPEEPEGGDQSMARIEAKLDLLTALVAGLARQDEDPLRELRWSARGACLVLDTAPPVGEGLFRIRPADWLPSTLLLPATVLAHAPADAGLRVWLRFDPLSPALEGALERHLFRIHRRAVAESRRPRPGF